MAAPRFTPVDPMDNARGYTSPDHVPTEWRADRPGDLTGRQPTGTRLGYQGPDQGYALLLASRVRPEVVTQPHEHVADAVAGATAIALRRASVFGRAPVIHDLRMAFTMWGWFDGSPPDELVALRRDAFEGVADTLHHYDLLRDLADSVPEETLRATPAVVAARYPGEWRQLLGR
ncbi:MAG: hypothetical protein ACR2HP_13830 [Ilumatobacteraceae bacterium]